MVSYNPENRPTIDEILDDDWMKKIKELNEEQIKKLENEIKDEFISREITIKDQLEQQMEIDEDDEIKSSFLGSIRSGEEEIKEYFDQNLKPKFIKNENGMQTFVKIKGILNPVNFMNKLITKIYDIFDNNCYIEEKKYSLKFNIIFTEEENNNTKEEIPKEIENDLNKLGINFEEENNDDDDELGICKKECIIQVALFEKNKNEYLLRFTKEFGELENYYKNFSKIKNIIKTF